MKVHELFEESLQAYLARLVRDHGIEKLGGGAFSQVFQHPQFHNVITKVYTGKDTVYARYSKWCEANQGNKYVPNIIEQVEYKNGNDFYHIIFMEKMRSIKSLDEYVTQMSKTLGSKSEEERNEVDAAINGKLTDFFEFIDHRVFEKRTDDDFKRLWSHIKTYGKNRFDLHEANVMMRGNQLVFTDPVANTPGTRVDEI